jgi:hypothetical protein
LQSLAREEGSGRAALVVSEAFMVAGVEAGPAACTTGLAVGLSCGSTLLDRIVAPAEA